MSKRIKAKQKRPQIIRRNEFVDRYSGRRYIMTEFFNPNSQTIKIEVRYL